jgi:ribosomal protein L7/L12
MLAEGRRIEAIKVYREHTGAGLKDAKDAVEAIEQARPIGLPTGASGAVDETFLDLLRAGSTINAIKRYREVTGASLKDAKDAVVRLREAHGFTVRDRAGCLGFIVPVFLALGIGLLSLLS